MGRQSKTMSKSLKQIGCFIKKHPVWMSILSLVFIGLPQWFSAVWALFCSEPFFKWIHTKGITMIHPLIFSWNWITMPIGFAFLIYIAWQSRKPKEEPVSDLEIEFTPSNPKPAKKHPCQIRIRNKSLIKNADD